MLLHFDNPSMLLGLVLVAGLAALMIFQGRRYPASFAPRRVWLATMGFTLCVLALSRPQLGHQTTESRSTRTNLFIAIDISRSMVAEDITPNRLQFAVAFCQKLLDFLPGARVALYPFAVDGFMLMPLSNDLQAAAELLSTLDPGMTTSQGTDYTISLQTLFERIQRMEGEAERTVAGWAPPQVLLLSDGETQRPISGQVLRLFRDAQIPVHTVGVGTPGGANLFIPSGFGAYTMLHDNRGQVVRTRLEPHNLKTISDATGGTYFNASFHEVGRVIQRLTQSLQLGRLTVKFKADKELFPFLFGLAFLLFTLEFALGRWQYAIRAVLFCLIVGGGAARGEDEEPEIDFPFEVRPPAEAPEQTPLPSVRRGDDRTHAVELFNQGLEELKKGQLDRAAERFQESAHITPDKTVRKKALFNLGNAYLRMMDPSQAVQTYQEAYDTRTDDRELEEEANRKISENIVLATRLEQQMRQSAREQGESRDGNDKREGQDRGGPQKDYDPQPLSEQQKKKMFDVLSAEEQQILKRLMERKNRNKPKDPNGRPW